MRKQELRMKDLIQVKDLIKEEKISPVMDRVYPFEQIQEAHSYVDTGRKRGNVVVRF